MILRRLPLKPLCAILLCFTFSNSYADLASEIAACKETVAREELSSDILIAELCPDLVAEIESGSWHESLEADWQDELAYWELSQFEYFVDFYREDVAEQSGISLSPLDEIVAGLGGDVNDNVDQSLWDRFKEWLTSFLDQETANNSGWFANWLSNIQIPASVMEVIFWVLSALIVIAAVAVIIIEVRAARQSVPEHLAGKMGSRVMGGAHVAEEVLTLKHLEDAVTSEKPSILMRLFLQRLDQLGITSVRASRTHREASTVVSQLGNDGAEVFSRISELAERARFSGREDKPQEISQVVASGIGLLNDLKPRQA